MKISEQALTQARIDDERLRDDNGPLPFTYAVLDTFPGRSRQNLEEIRQPAATVWSLNLRRSDYKRYAERNVSPSPPDRSILDVAVDDQAPKPPPQTLFITIRPNLDTVCALAAWLLQAWDRPLLEARLATVRNGIGRDYAPWQPRPLPRLRAPAPPDGGIRHLSGDRRLALASRVHLTAQWLSDASFDVPLYTQACEEIDDQIARAIARRRLVIDVDGDVAHTITSHPGALRAAFHLAPVVVATNPAHPGRGAAPHLRHTIAQARRGFLNASRLKKTLNRQDPGWTGSYLLMGSPTGRNSALSHRNVVDLTHQHRLGRSLADDDRPV